MQQIKAHFNEAYRAKQAMSKAIDPMTDLEMTKSVDKDAQISYAIDHALRSIDKIVAEGKGTRELSLVKTKLQEAEFWLFKMP